MEGSVQELGLLTWIFGAGLGLNCEAYQKGAETDRKVCTNQQKSACGIALIARKVTESCVLRSGEYGLCENSFCPELIKGI
jgi:hypothetical protein